MQAAPAVAVPPKARSEPLANAVIGTWLAAWLLSRALSILEAAYGLGEVWQLAVYAVLSVLAVALVVRARRRFLARPAVEPGQDERSWKVAIDDLQSQDLLQAPAVFTLFAIGVAATPWAVVVWPDNFRSLFAVLVGWVALADFADYLLAGWVQREGLIETVAGSRAPAGWWGLAALAVGLPLVWLPVVVMASAASPAALLVLVVPLVNGLAWGYVGMAWSRPWRIDRRLRAIPLEWFWRRRKKRLISLTVAPSVLGLLLVYQPAFGEVLDGGCIVDLTWLYWWFVLLGLLWTGAVALAREAPPPAAQEPLSPGTSRSA